MNLVNKKIEFFKNNPNSFVAFYYFITSLVDFPVVTISVETLMKTYSLFSTDLQNSEVGKLTYEYIQKKKSLKINNSLPSFRFLDTTFRAYDLSQFRDDKYVLVCFWASWCGPCIKNIPLLKEINAKYSSSQFEMISVSIDTDVDKWIAAVKKFQMPWLQTCDVEKYAPGQMIAKMFDVTTVPQYFLIGKTGRLIYQSVQDSDTNDHPILKDILNKKLTEPIK